LAAVLASSLAVISSKGLRLMLALTVSFCPAPAVRRIASTWCGWLTKCSRR
jgi:hypothetical protein